MTINYALFHDPRYGGEGIARSWFHRATRIQNCYDNEFERFTALWTAFAAWGMCVTLAESDAVMLRMLGVDARANAVFDDLIAGDLFAGRLSEYEGNFPLPSFSDLLRLDPHYNWRGPRDNAFWMKIAEAPRGKRVRLSPRLNADDLRLDVYLLCTYKIRCNLAHGGKMFNRAEGRFVAAFAEILEPLTHRLMGL